MAKKTVARSRLRSTMEPPPNELPPPPMPKAPESPASLPECRSTRKIRTTEMMTWTTPRIVYTGGEFRRRPLAASGAGEVAKRPAGHSLDVSGSVLGLELVELPHQLDRLASQLGVDAPEVGIGEFSGRVIQLRVADLPVLG